MLDRGLGRLGADGGFQPKLFFGGGEQCKYLTKNDAGDLRWTGFLFLMVCFVYVYCNEGYWNCADTL